MRLLQEPGVKGGKRTASSGPTPSSTSRGGILGDWDDWCSEKQKDIWFFGGACRYVLTGGVNVKLMSREASPAPQLLLSGNHCRPGTSPASESALLCEPTRSERVAKAGAPKDKVEKSRHGTASDPCAAGDVEYAGGGGNYVEFTVATSGEHASCVDGGGGGEGAFSCSCRRARDEATFKGGAGRRTKFTGNAQEKKSHQTGQQIAGERLAQSALRRRSEERGHGLHHAMKPLQCASIRRTALFNDEGVRKTGHGWRCSDSSGLLITSAAGGSANKVQVPKQFQLSTTHAPQSPLCCYNIDIKILFV